MLCLFVFMERLGFRTQALTCVILERRRCCFLAALSPSLDVDPGMTRCVGINSSLAKGANNDRNDGDEEIEAGKKRHM